MICFHELVTAIVILNMRFQRTTSYKMVMLVWLNPLLWVFLNAEGLGLIWHRFLNWQQPMTLVMPNAQHSCGVPRRCDSASSSI